MGKKEKQEFLVGVFDNESKLISAIETLRAKGLKIHDVYTPYPVHDLDVYLGFKRTRLARAAFLFGITGTTLAITMQSYMLGFAWPMIIGGKDHIAVPDFVPVTFELTVLCASLGMVATFLISNGLGPGKKALMFDPRSTDDKYVMAINLGKNSKFTKVEIEKMLLDNGVSEQPKTKEV
ncbi:MAG: DUF3341 domain-containing protein [Bacteroidetes bacterium]|nr:MAG: DUF3341 domain-containing protein [Bacteroidota bacterium]TAG89501.1 MAG: DUF3341 domain-containing protein [Bacteroidota bacterium]